MVDESMHAAALTKIEALLPSGQLRIITATHRCFGGEPTAGAGGNGIPKSPEEIAACELYAAAHSRPGLLNPLADPEHFVIHVATHIEGPDAKGRVALFSDEGDITTGYPYAVLQRALEAFTANPLG